jgi:hypothetical protein
MAEKPQNPKIVIPNSGLITPDNAWNRNKHLLSPEEYKEIAPNPIKRLRWLRSIGALPEKEDSTSTNQ